MLKKHDLFYCHSLKLFYFLKSKGFYYISKGINDKTGFNYWVFEKTDELNSSVIEFSKNKSSN